MSLRQRFIILALLATLAIGAAVASMVQLFARSDTAREQAGRDSADAMVSALGRDVGLRVTDERALRDVATSVAAPQTDARAGFCTEGTFIIATSPGPRREPQRADLPSDQQDFVNAACAAATTEMSRQRLPHPHDVVVVSTQRISASLTAWALVRVPTHPEEGPQLTVGLLVMAIASLALAGLTIEAITSLRRGAADLELALFRLRDNLRSELPTPRPKELARIADGLRSMGLQLASAHDRALTLERELSHEQRLAGLGRVTAGVAHEIRNPLAAIKLKLDGLARREHDERTRADVQTCLEEVRRLDEIVGAMLLVARKTPAHPETLGLGELADERITILTELVAARDVKLSRTGDAVVHANRITLTRVLDNLLRNAIEASPKGGEIRIVLGAEAGRATIDVTDNGPGVPAERASELFEPFFTTKPEGTGLGLWLSRSLLEVDGGTLVYTRDGAQTRFIASLPSAHVEQDAEHPHR